MRGFFLSKKFFKWCLVLSLFDAYQLRKKIFFLLGLPFTPPYLRICEGFFNRTAERHFPLEGDDHKHHLETFPVGGLTLTPSNVRICERTFFGTTKYGNTLLGDARNHHLNRFQKFFLKLGLQKGGWNSELVKGLSKKFLSQGWLYPLLASE